MSRWIKNFIVIASLLLVSCTGPSLPKTNSNPDFIQTQTAVEVENTFGSVLEVFDADNLSLAEKKARKAAVKIRSLLHNGHGSGTYMVAYGRHVVATAAHVVRGERKLLIDGRDGETVLGQVVFVDRNFDIASLDRDWETI